MSINNIQNLKIGLTTNSAKFRETMLNKNIGTVDNTYLDYISSFYKNNYSWNYQILKDNIGEMIISFKSPKYLSNTDDTNLGKIAESIREYTYLNSFQDSTPNTLSFKSNFKYINTIIDYKRTVIKKGLSNIKNYQPYSQINSIDEFNYYLSNTPTENNSKISSIYYTKSSETVGDSLNDLPISDYTKMIRGSYKNKYTFSQPFINESNQQYRQYDYDNRYPYDRLKEVYYEDSKIYSWNYEQLKDDNEFNSILYKTNELFSNRDKNKTLIYNKSIISDAGVSVVDMIQNNINYRISRGRNVTKTDNNLDYFRTWTKAKQYSKMRNLIKPFKKNDGRILTMEELQNDWDNSSNNSYNRGRASGGLKNLIENTVIGNNGLIKISPTSDNPTIKNCMFSIENLAWKDVNLEKYLSPEQRGSMGGRIMWFPPYNIKFTENVSVNWNQEAFIGRGEQIYTYSNTERSGTLDFSILVDYPSIVEYWKGKNIFNDADGEKKMINFFAGIVPEVTQMVEKPEQQQHIDSKPKMESKSEKIEIDIYLPNAYSGIDDIDNIDDVFEYLFWGRDAQKINTIGPIDGNYDTCRGYEMRPSLGISTDEVDGGFLTGVLKGKNIIYAYRVDSKNLHKEILNKKKITSNSISKDTQSIRLNSSSSETKISFAEFYLGLYKMKNKSDEFEKRKTYLINYCGVSKDIASTNIDLIYNIFKKNDENTTIKIIPSASQPGGPEINKTLLKNRSNVVRTLIKKYANNFNIETISGAADIKISGSENDSRQKKWRAVKIVIETKSGNIKQDGNYDSEKFSNGKGTQNTSKVKDIKPPVIYDGGRYDNEYNFFNIINNEDPINREKLVDKLKYFNPAFHSITPEGFNSRLTFLHQCTRQGNTNKFGGGDTTTAANLAFGRPPVCILRIGDFYNTRIIIDSIVINYDQNTWDFNQEGIGMQPMMANISLTFKFIGGSDLTGPINRLQNAVSFNYYANASVYDNRADRDEFIFSAKNDLTKTEDIKE